ncbi:SDR family oxidoreductase [Thioalkalivibrio sp. XN279]|uniref:SDR family oxidoreductase n=1 Tax=Thioalkalivibrio sp. XN279 TaxID=2714953 RepID=UPI00140D725B|nr:SDR family oxidoreductase [Thioalkalivibrio sp. XN279]NHA15051.1 SDR family oxidoreductase [Thioalkalivibrio sp. XN279]
MHLSLEGRRAVVCGASRGIGKAIAGVLAEMGAELILVARDEAALAAVAEGLPGGRERHGIRALDLLDTAAVKTCFSEMAAQAPVHVLINNTGGPAAGTAFDGKPEDYERAFRQHVVAAQVAAQALVPGMRKAGYGRIINITSTSVKEPIPGLGVSNTIRAAVASWAKTLSRELASQGITVNNVLPGFTSTERLDYLFRQRAQHSGNEVEEVERAAIAQVPAGRFARPEEIAWAVGFLASPQAAYISGINVPVDGGRMASL